MHRHTPAVRKAAHGCVSIIVWSHLNCPQADAAVHVRLGFVQQIESHVSGPHIAFSKSLHNDICPIDIGLITPVFPL